VGKAMGKISQRNGMTMKQWEEGESGSVGLSNGHHA